MTEQSELEELRLKAGKLHAQIQRIESAAMDKVAQEKLGKCYRYNNSYSSGERWWLYRRVTSVKDGWLNTFDFQHCSDGRIEIRHDHLCIGTHDLGEPITLRQFQHAWKIMARMLNSRATAAKAYQP